EELDRRLLEVDDVVVDAPARPDTERLRVLSAQPELRIGSDRRLGVSWHVDLWHHVDGALRRVGDDLAQIVLRVEASVGTAVAAGIGCRTELALAPPRPHLGESGVALHLDAPSLV